MSCLAKFLHSLTYFLNFLKAINVINIKAVNINIINGAYKEKTT